MELAPGFGGKAIGWVLMLPRIPGGRVVVILWVSLFLGPVPCHGGEMHGNAELRPTWTFATGKTDTRGTFSLCYWLSDEVRLLYSQGINFDLKNPEAYGGRRFAIVDGSLGLVAMTLWAPADSGFRLAYEPSVLLPTESLKRSNGLLLGVRQNLSLTREFSGFSLTGSLILWVFGYSRPGGENSAGAPAANPLVETGVELTAGIPLGRDVALALAIKFYQRRYASYRAGAVNHDVWTFHLARSSEVLVRINPNLVLGLAFQTGNFAGEDLSGFSVGQGWKNGVLQGVINASF